MNGWMQTELEMLAKALECLPQQQRDVIVLTYYDRMKDSEIAVRMALTPKRVAELRTAAEAELKRQGIT